MRSRSRVVRGGKADEGGQNLRCYTARRRRLGLVTPWPSRRRGYGGGAVVEALLGGVDVGVIGMRGCCLGVLNPCRSQQAALRPWSTRLVTALLFTPLPTIG